MMMRRTIIVLVVCGALVGTLCEKAWGMDLAESTWSKEPVHKHAYALIHYEGTPLDAEYLLGARVLITSLERTEPEADIVVLVSENVTPETRAVLAATSARLKYVPNIPNPYKYTNAGEGEGDGGEGAAADPSEASSYKAHFEHSLNKLHLWDMVEYERVIYMDEDSIALRNMDILFKCGHFCAAYQNPVNFHTGMLVLKPDRAVFDDMLDALRTGMASYDGGDQGFFVSYFAGLAGAPLFDRTPFLDSPDAPALDDPLLRLDIVYSMNHIYYYEKFNWKLYRLPQYEELKTSSVPAFSMTFPIAQAFKPWNWVPYWYMDIHWVWLSLRARLDDNTPGENFVRLLVATVLPAATHWYAITYLGVGDKLFGPGSPGARIVRPYLARASSLVGTRVLVWGLMAGLVVCVKLATALIYSTMYPIWAWSFFVLAHLGFFRLYLDTLTRITTSNARGVDSKSLLPLAALIVGSLYLSMTIRFPEFLSKLIFSLVMFLVIGERHNALLTEAVVVGGDGGKGGVADSSV